MPPLAVEVINLQRRYRTGRSSIVALQDVSFAVEEGQIVGLLGSNGAGKTTLTKILGTLLLPTAGSARVFGHDVVKRPKAVRASIAMVLGGERGLYTRLSGRDNARFFAMLQGVGRREITQRVEAALVQVGLAEAAGHRVETYSKGMRQRLHIAICLTSSPRLLLLDEPTVGLDPVEAERLRGSISSLRDSGVSVLLTSHYLLDIERLADRVLILDSGRIIRDMPTPDFAKLAGYVATVSITGYGDPPLLDMSSHDGVSVESVSADGPMWRVNLRVRDWDGEAVGCLSHVLNTTAPLSVDVRSLRLEDVYSRHNETVPSGA